MSDPSYLGNPHDSPIWEELSDALDKASTEAYRGWLARADRLAVGIEAEVRATTEVRAAVEELSTSVTTPYDRDPLYVAPDEPEPQRRRDARLILAALLVMLALLILRAVRG